MVSVKMKMYLVYSQGSKGGMCNFSLGEMYSMATNGQPRLGKAEPM
jgi:hypothetical protein